MDNGSLNLADSDGVSVHAGFPNAALDQRRPGQSLAFDLNALLVQHPDSTYLFRVSGHSWTDQGIQDGNIALIDRARVPLPHDLVVSEQGSDFRLCRYFQCAPGEQPWGVITAIIHQYSH